MSLKNKVIISIILFSIAIRAYNIENPFSTNGIDEGIHLLQAKMVREGYNYYNDLQGDQAPLAILTFSIFEGNVLTCRYLSYFLFIISSIFLFFIAKKFGKDVALIALLIISLDFTLLRESRLASLDLFSATLLCISSFFFLNYIEKGCIANLALSAIFFSLSLLSKIVPVFFILFPLFYLFLRKKNLRYGIIYIFFLVAPLLAIFLIFSPHQLIEGVLLRQAHRDFDFYSKLSLLIFIASCFIYLFAIRKWNIKNEKISYLVAWVLLILIPLLFQGRTFQHHFVYISYPLAILASIALHEKWVRKREILLAIFIAFNLFLVVFFIFTAPKDLAYNVADEIENITDENDLVISGNPLVNVIANRSAPPNLTNLAKYHYPETTLNDIIYWLEKNETKVIVLYYHLYEIEGLQDYLNTSREWYLYEKIKGKGQVLFYGISMKFSRDVYEIYVKT